MIYRPVFEPHPPLAPLVSHVSPRVIAAIDRALAKQAADRFADMASLFEQKTSRAFVILTRAYCKTGDLGAAQASLRNLAAAERAQVVRACKAEGMDL